MLIGLLGLMLILYIVLVVADLYLYYRLAKQVDLIESRLLTVELTPEKEDSEWTKLLSSR